MKANHFARAMIFAITVSVFFACSEGSPNGSGDSSDSNNNPSSSSNNSSDSNSNPSSGSNGMVDINSQVYHIQCNTYDVSCSLDILYEGSGTVKGVFMSAEDDEQVLGMMDMGTVNNGKINLEFHTPKEEFQKKGFEIRLYRNDAFVGRLYPMAANFSYDNRLIARYFYFPENFQNINTSDMSQEHGVIFIDDVDVKKGWNLIYEKDEYKDIDGKRVNTVIHTSDAGILNGIELRWFLLDPEMH
ncbi:MAG: hypothetical protein LBQ76_04095 [Candidatus Fibromonas sp.]|jgi:hypothetical protein|nr:hypothetical protein [Candidatus Fibromonas sp.]